MTTKTEPSPDSTEGTRADAFKEEVKALKIKDPHAGRERGLLTLGIAGLVVGIVVTVVSYFVSHGTSNPLEQNDAQTIGMIGIAITLAGAAIFVRYSFASFMRFWLARFLFEQQRGRD